MKYTRPQSAILALFMTKTVFGHAGISNFYVNGVNQGDAVCLRMNTDANKWSNPIEDLNSSDMACGFTGTKGVGRVCQVPDGSTVTFKWTEDPSQHSGPVIDDSHLGSCAVYMKKVDSAISDNAAGDGWFKIWDEGYDQQTKKWCTKKLIDNGGYLSAQVPKGLIGGYYLVRAELLALQNVEQGDPQYFIGCAQVFLQSSGSDGPQSTVKIPGEVSKNDAADTVNIYKPIRAPYPIPGPAVASIKAVSLAQVQTTQTEGLKPTGCICESGSGFCGLEVPDYGTDEKSCWAVSTIPTICDTCY